MQIDQNGRKKIENTATLTALNVFCFKLAHSNNSGSQFKFSCTTNNLKKKPLKYF